MTPASSATPPRAALEPNGREPLKGLRVVEIGVAMAGPFCAMLLGDYGADVVKLERPQVGDDSRSWSPYFHESLSYYYAAANRNKRSVSVDIKTPEGAAIARKLLEQADVLVNIGNTEWVERTLAALPDSTRMFIARVLRSLRASPPASLGVPFEHE